MQFKYVRIQGREDSYITKYPKGIFSLCWNLLGGEQTERGRKRAFYSHRRLVQRKFSQTRHLQEPRKGRHFFQA